MNGLSASAYGLAGAAGLVPLAPVFGCELRTFSVQLPPPVYRQTPHVATPIPDQQYRDDVVALDELDREVTAARHRAYGQLREGAARAGADAVIDIHQIGSSFASLAKGPDPARVAAAVRPGPHPYVARTYDCQVVGTAVRRPASRCAEPQLGNVSASDYWKLLRAGWQPVDVVGGCAHRFGASLWGGSAGHEVQGSTAVWAAARAAAMAQLKLELSGIEADGVIGIQMEADHQLLNWTERVEFLGQTGKMRRARLDRQGLLVSVSVLGTAVRRVQEPDADRVAVLRVMDIS